LSTRHAVLRFYQSFHTTISRTRRVDQDFAKQEIAAAKVRNAAAKS
jgi:hypothetical protein